MLLSFVTKVTRRVQLVD